MTQPLNLARDHTRRKSALVSMQNMKMQQRSAYEEDGNDGAKMGKHSDDEYDEEVGRRRATTSSDDDDGEATTKNSPKKRSSNKRPRLNSSRGKYRTTGVESADLLFGKSGDTIGEPSMPACEPPARRHTSQYHRTILLEASEGRKARAALLDWFDGVRTRRSMPWRKDWINPISIGDKDQLRELLKRRAYEVWISEIMLQQTRVTTVISYWNNWMAKWPTIEALAKAEPEEVLSAWRGLGYYSRATRIHTAARKVVEDGDMQGLLPETADSLQKNVPGIGRYTGGAIAAIVFGNAAPMVDGNVLRVLSRQLGIFGDVKSSKKVIDLLWNAADVLVKHVAADGRSAEEGETDMSKKSENPGLWGQALMELGSTICTPNPTCRSCPIQESCRAYGEGVLLADRQGLLPQKKPSIHLVTDIEDLCSVCQPFGEEAHSGEASEGIAESLPTIESNKTRIKMVTPKQLTLSAFAFTKAASGGGVGAAAAPTGRREKEATASVYNEKVHTLIESHAKKFPMKVVKKAVREQSTVVCAVRNSLGEILLHQRPDKGLLAGMWELPSETLPEGSEGDDIGRGEVAEQYVRRLLGDSVAYEYGGEIEAIPWLFSHLRLTMYVHLFTLRHKKPLSGRWASATEVEAESMGTGMRKCWTAVKDL